VCGRRGRALALLLRSWIIWPRRLKIEQSRPAWRLIMLARILTSKGVRQLGPMLSKNLDESQVDE